MGQITTGVGLISGLPIADIIDQLMAIEARPKQLVQKQNAILTSQQTAYQEINAKLLALKLSAASLANATTFKATAATSSNESVLTATSSSGAVPGNYFFTVHRLVAAQQVITSGFADTTSTAVGATTLTFERGEARLDANTLLSDLNGGEGLKRGKIRITDRSGASAVVDLSTAVTVSDVIDAINSTLGISVTASVSGDALILTDNTGLTASNLIVADVGVTGTATSLGLAGSVAADTLTGAQINRVGQNTLLASLNDRNGVQIQQSVANFRITTAGGGSYDIDLTGAATLGDVIDAINTTTGGEVTASIGDDGVSLKLIDTTGGGAGFTVTALNGSSAAADLGILGSDADGDGQIAGGRIVAAMNSKLLKHLNGGAGVATPGTIAITNRSGVATQVDLSAATSVSDVIDLINASGAGVTASLNRAGNGILLTDATGGSGDLVISDVSGTAAADLHLAGTYSASTVDSGNLQFKYITGATRLDQLGITRGKFTITDSSGASATVDLTQGDEVTIDDVLREINSRGLQINARINDTGDGILIEDLGPGAGKLKVEEAGSTTAADLGILGEAENPGDDLNGSFEKTLTIDASATLENVVTAINEAGVGVTASILNDGSAGAPYRLILSAKEAGTGGAFVFDDGGAGWGAATLSQAQDALVFFGPPDPAQALLITSKSNKLVNAVPGTTIDLHATSSSPVQLTISKDADKITQAASDFVTKFNEVVTAMDKYDTYDSEKQERGLLLGDSAVAAVRRALYNLVIKRDTQDLSGQYQSLAQVGITIGSGAKLEFDEGKFLTALDNDPDAVAALFTFKQTEEDEVTGETTITASGIGVEIDELLKRLTDSETGVIQLRVDAIDDQIELNNKRLASLDQLLAAKRAKLEAEFLAMERALATLQQQSQALGSFQTALAGNKKSASNS